MRLIHLAIFILFLVFNANADIVVADSNYLPSIHYTKKELKKEKKDIKAFDKLVKEWKKAIRQNNTDYLNVVFSRVKTFLEKEHNELSNRISKRSKELYPSKSDTKPTNSVFEDKPKVYNSELKDQIIRVNKEDIMRKKAEYDYLNKYIQVIRNEKDLIIKLNSVLNFDNQTPSSIYLKINQDLANFRNDMLEEISLMKKETGKK